jgi:hypothetical protein
LNIQDCVGPGSGIPLLLFSPNPARRLSLNPWKKEPLAMAYPRDTPLDVCPNLACRRSGLCFAADPARECHKTHMSAGEFHDHIAARLCELWIEWGGDPADLHKPAPEPSPEAWADFWNAMREREAEYDAAQYARLLAEVRRSANSQL